MKIGVITDTHLGVRENGEDEFFELLEMVSEAFQERDVDTVLHLGDIAHEEPALTYESRVEKVNSVFDWADRYLPTMGNHDAEAMATGEFQETFGVKLNQVVYEDEESVVLLINSSGTGYYAGFGFIDDPAMDLLGYHMGTEKDVHIFTHYPLQFTEFYRERPIFKTHPEYTFPINKGVLTRKYAEAGGSVQFYCGHMHPEETVTVTTEPLGYKLTVFEPLQLFEQNGLEVDWSVHDGIDIDSLIFEF